MKFKIQITSSLLSGLFQSILAFLYETFQTDFADLQLRTEKNKEKKSQDWEEKEFSRENLDH